MDNTTALLIDFNNVLYAHYYTKPLLNSKGQNINAIKGFLMRLKNLREIYNPKYIVICHDISRERTFRRELYKDYKGQRGTTDSDVRWQMDRTIQLLALMGYPILGNERFEADDFIGMTSHLLTELGMNSVIVSADKDLYQLVNDHTCIWSFRKGITVDEDYMMHEFGLRPDQWIDLKILQGDKSDNIPGIGGIGEKTALQLMKGFGSIQGIYNNITKLSPTLKDKLMEGKDNIPLTRKLVTIVTDYKLMGIDESVLHRTEPFIDEVYSVLRELEIPSLFNVIRYDLLPKTLNI